MGAMGNMVDVRKWNWPGYLTFGKSGSPSKSSGLHNPSTPPPPTPKQESGETPSPSPGVQELAVEGLLQVKYGEIDTESLHEAINSEHVHSPQPSQLGLSPASHSPSVPATPARSLSPSPATETEVVEVGDASEGIETSKPDDEDEGDKSESEGEGGTRSESDTASHSPSVEAPHESPEPEEPEEPIPSFNISSIHLANGDDPSATSRKRVLHLTVRLQTSFLHIAESLDLCISPETSIDHCLDRGA